MVKMWKLVLQIVFVLLYPKFCLPQEDYKPEAKYCEDKPTYPALRSLEGIQTNFSAFGHGTGGNAAINLFMIAADKMVGVATVNAYMFLCGAKDSDKGTISSGSSSDSSSDSGGQERDDADPRLLQCIQERHKYDTSLAIYKELQEKKLVQEEKEFKDKRIFIQGSAYSARPAGGNFKIQNDLYKFFSQFTKSIQLVQATAQNDLPTPACGAETCKQEGYSVNHQGEIRSNKLGHCGYSLAFNAISYLYGGRLVKHRTMYREFDRCDAGKRHQVDGLYRFDQRKYGGTEELGFLEYGFVFYASVCFPNKLKYCQILFVFHDCNPFWTYTTRRQWVTGSGFLDIAHSNGLIVVFPQASSNRTYGENCFDAFSVGDFSKQANVVYDMAKAMHGKEATDDGFSGEPLNEGDTTKDQVTGTKPGLVPDFGDDEILTLEEKRIEKLRVKCEKGKLNNRFCKRLVKLLNDKFGQLYY